MKTYLLAILIAMQSVTFTYSAFAIGTGQPENEALASELNYFTIKAINLTSLLSWSSSSPKNYDYFIIERSSDGKNYSEIGKLKSAGTSNFNFVDYKPDNHINYYRFKKIDFDGSQAISPVRVVIIEKDSPYTVYPTLAKNILTIQKNNISNDEAEAKIQLILISTGEVIYETKIEAYSNKMEINIASLPSGNYVTRIQKINNTYNHLFVKQ